MLMASAWWRVNVTLRADEQDKRTRRLGPGGLCQGRKMGSGLFFTKGRDGDDVVETKDQKERESERDRERERERTDKWLGIQTVTVNEQS
mgnify:CR=1 FL=1